MANTATNQQREMRVAVERVVGFAQEYGEAHLNLACHAAFPLSLTPDLLYQIWANFVPEAPWTAVARVLLSRLCKEVGSEMYEMDNAVRNLLLRELKVQFRQERFDSLGEFLLEYVSQRLTDDDPDTQDLRQAQQWTALAYTRPEQAARELAKVLSERVQQEDIGEVLRLSSLVETLSEPLVEAGFEPLLIYGQGMKSYVCGDLEIARKQLDAIKTNNQINIAEINLNIPPIFLKETLNKKGLRQLRKVASKLEVTRYSQMRKVQLQAAIEKNIDFLNLKNLLAKRKWKEADLATAELIFQISKREKERWLTIEDIEKFPIQDLIIINKLWINASNSHFGFSMIEVNDQNLKTINNLGLQVFDFESITVNSRGEEIKREIQEAEFFREDITLLLDNDVLLGNDTFLGNMYLEIVYIPGGQFLMGSPEGEKESNINEHLQHKVSIRPFYMSKYPITQAQWRNISKLPKVNRELQSNPSRFKGNNRPVEQVSWYDAVEFCDRLSKRTNKKYRLPSEAEWEYACRAGTSTPFNFGETITSDLTNYDGTLIYKNEPKGIQRGETNEVDRFSPNQFGLYDMHGNVREWCGDSWHETYENAPSDGSTWIDRNTQEKVIRGGSWMSRPDLCRSAYRGKKEPKINNCSNFGFRVVCIM